MNTNERILLNMAINNMERKILQMANVKSGDFVELVNERFKLYKEIHQGAEK